MEITKTLVIPRSRWARVTENKIKPCGESLLLNQRESLCCLGHDCRMNGATDDKLLDRAMPGILSCSLPEKTQLEATDLNDRRSYVASILSDVEQEAAIVALFARYGVNVLFVD